MVLCAVLLAQTASAARVAVVIEMPDGTVTKCVPAAENGNGYIVVEDAGENAVWSYYGYALGHGLCGINGVGCPASDCYCNPSVYWNFYVKSRTAAGSIHRQASTEAHHAANTTVHPTETSSAYPMEAMAHSRVIIRLMTYAVSCRETICPVGLYCCRRL